MCCERLQHLRVGFYQLLSHQTVMRKNFRGAASVTTMPLFAVTPVMKTYTATAASGSVTYIYYNNHNNNPVLLSYSGAFAWKSLGSDAQERWLWFGMLTMTQINCRQAAAILLSSMNIKYLVWWIINPLSIISPGKAMINMRGWNIAPLTTLHQRRRGRHDSETVL